MDVSWTSHVGTFFWPRKDNWFGMEFGACRSGAGDSGMVLLSPASRVWSTCLLSPATSLLSLYQNALTTQKCNLMVDILPLSNQIINNVGNV